MPRSTLVRFGTGSASPPALGSYEPSASTTGHSGSLTLLSGNQTITTAGTTIENRDITGKVIVQAANVTIRNCRIRGAGAESSNTALVFASSGSVSNLLIEDCTLVPDTPSVWWNGINGHDFTARRCNIYHTVDGCGLFNNSNPGGPINVTIEGCYIHDLSYITPDPNHTGDNQTHNDGIQLQGGSGAIIRWNSINAYYSATVGTQPTPKTGTVGNPGYDQGGALACLMFNNDVGATTEVNIYENWLRGWCVREPQTSAL